MVAIPTVPRWRPQDEASMMLAMSTVDPNNMVWIPGGMFRMGSDDHYPEEGPAHDVEVDGFWMDPHPVTNEEFARFVDATGHVTSAERAPLAEDYPGALPELLVPASVVFVPPAHRVDLSQPTWWDLVPGADWRRPRGPGSSVEGLSDHPVCHVAWEDAEAYAAWVGKSIATEAEWEFASRGGLDGAEYAWGDELNPNGEYLANNWQGEFPAENLALDGFEATSPVGSYPANAYGLFDMIGNVWEWTSDWYQSHTEIERSCCTMTNPRGSSKAASIDPALPDIPIPRKVMKGGSYLCAPNYCRRYRPAARMAQPIDTSTCHLGFRCMTRDQTSTGV